MTSTQPDPVQPAAIAVEASAEHSVVTADTLAGSTAAERAPEAEAAAERVAPAAPAATTEDANAPDPMVLVDAPVPRPRPSHSVEPEVQKAETAVPTVKPQLSKPVRKASRPAPAPVQKPSPAQPPSPFGGAFAPFSAAQTGARGPTAGTSGAGGANRQAEGRASVSSYQATLFAHLRRFKQYPAEARRQGIRGTASVTFTVDASGRVVGASLSGSSGAAILDREALAIVRRASPFPPMPAGLGQPRMTVRAPIRFDIR